MTSLRQRMIEDMQIRNLAVPTQDTYVLQVSMFARHFGKSPEMLGPEEIRTYQVYLTNEKKLATSSILIAICALRSGRIQIQSQHSSCTSASKIRSREDSRHHLGRVHIQRHVAARAPAGQVRPRRHSRNPTSSTRKHHVDLRRMARRRVLFTVEGRVERDLRQ